MWFPYFFARVPVNQVAACGEEGAEELGAGVGMGLDGDEGLTFCGCCVVVLVEGIKASTRVGYRAFHPRDRTERFECCAQLILVDRNRIESLLVRAHTCCCERRI